MLTQHCGEKKSASDVRLGSEVPCSAGMRGIGHAYYIAQPLHTLTECLVYLYIFY